MDGTNGNGNEHGSLRLVLILVFGVCCVCVAGVVALCVTGHGDSTALAALLGILTPAGAALVGYLVRLLQRAEQERRKRDLADEERRREELRRIHKMPS